MSAAMPAASLTPEIIAERIAHFGPLKAGAHDPNDEACVMEVVSWVAGEKWSDIRLAMSGDCGVPALLE